MKIQKTTLCLITSILVSCASAPTNPKHSSSLEIRDLASEFLTDVCENSNDETFPDKWLAYEDKHWDFYKQVYYYNSERIQDRKLIAQKMTGRKREMCKYTQSFIAIAPPIIQTMATTVSDLIGATPKGPIYFSAALQWTDGRGATYNNEDIYTYNARHDTFATTNGLTATIAHELVHSAHTSKYGRKDPKITPLIRNLFWEGGAVYTVQVILPEVGEGATGLKPEELKQAAIKSPAAAQELLAHWDKPTLDEKIEDKYFSGGWKGSEQPRKMGYYIGLQLFKRLATKKGQDKTLKMSPLEFASAAKPILAELAAKR